MCALFHCATTAALVADYVEQPQNVRLWRLSGISTSEQFFHSIIKILIQRYDHNTGHCQILKAFVGQMGACVRVRVHACICACMYLCVRLRVCVHVTVRVKESEGD